MFIDFAKKYEKYFKVILIDFLGHGRSDRLEKFPVDLWFNEAEQIIAFLHEKQYKDVNIIGCSGGALVAINVALEADKLIDKVIADSFEGEKSSKVFTDKVIADRAVSVQDPNAQNFYAYMHGCDWKQIVDNDTITLIQHHEKIGSFFHKPLEHLKADILMTGSKTDEFMSPISPNYFETVYGKLIQKIGHGKIHLFKQGGHPAMLTNPDEFYTLSMDFFTDIYNE